MRNKVIFILATLGLLAGLVSAYILGIEKKPPPPAFKPASNPYGKGIYANGIIESYQTNGKNINIYPEVSGTITGILVAEGATIKKETPLLLIEDSIPRATAEQQRSQIELARASLKSAQDQLDKQKRSYDLNPKSVSRNDLDNAENAVKVAKANIKVAEKQHKLALTQLAKYTIKSTVDGTVLSINAAVGSYISAQGTYDTYTQGFGPILTIGSANEYMGLRCYIDEILVHRLPLSSPITAKMFIRGTNISIPVEYVRVQPYVSPKIELSNQRTERVDVRVLPVLFRFSKPKNITLYPGQLVDVYIAEK